MYYKYKKTLTQYKNTGFSLTRFYHRKELLGLYKEAVDAGYMPAEDPPDLMAVSRDMICRVLCCRGASVFPESYLSLPAAASSRHSQRSRTASLTRQRIEGISVWVIGYICKLLQKYLVLNKCTVNLSC